MCALGDYLLYTRDTTCDGFGEVVIDLFGGCDFFMRGVWLESWF